MRTIITVQNWYYYLLWNWAQYRLLRNKWYDDLKNNIRQLHYHIVSKRVTSAVSDYKLFLGTNCLLDLFGWISREWWGLSRKEWGVGEGGAASMICRLFVNELSYNGMLGSPMWQLSPLLGRFCFGTFSTRNIKITHVSIHIYVW